ncbi:MAG: hypothetical protein A2Y03_07340 [Omnitrophica WOR_2 bacterium GWF2_38_59]|nr:MAG: hypothetical protein A2Y06_02970 [Omnitrophica WOR_2 bacterium GWA2_37_7]OGX26011.1 MAG: hypothetical protein A2Y03_07340 [Omnitrophica WOR_2 bacterium GWF2_38_59]OGX48867.1 MAG: hypothetical protein A2243_07600 [Omnitrophica WOR_2 bacterium RIFOXYA2_FULL_38_17]OGX54212.1 MAG: hypothetical protein A2267_04710 [Omnitrophica WOR_2 bacterium RIFOXYA12_FULL_38_10]OGX56841.1 MAG: hypothetical protein A2306_05410 [Omnitrophica WOR_2 bacterium RIFOXYB2_FULL_38_16]OGX57596.1 MAG: hypothetical 
MTNGKKFFFDVSWALSSTGVKALIAFLLSIVIGRNLGASDLGLYNLVFSIYNIGIIIPAFLISSALIKFVSENQKCQDKLDQIISCVSVSNISLSLIISIVIFFLAKPLSVFFKIPELKNLIKFICIIFPFVAIFQTNIGVLNGLRRMRSFAFFMILQDVMVFLLTFIFVINGFGVFGVLSGLIFAMAITALISFLNIRNIFTFSFTSFKQNLIEILSFGSKSFCGGIMNEINYRADIVLIGYFLTAKDVGYYSVAILLSRFFWIFPQSIQKIAYPATTSYWYDNKKAELQSMITKTMKFNACIVLFLGLLAIFYVEDIIAIAYNKSFLSSISPFLILLTGTLIDGATIRPINSTLAAIGKPEFSPKVAAAGATINIVLNLFLIPKYGINGAAIATTISLIIVVFLNSFYIVKNTNLSLNFSWHISLFILALFCIFIFKCLYVFGHLEIRVFILLFFILITWNYFLKKEDHLFLKKLSKQLHT